MIEFSYNNLITHFIAPDILQVTLNRPDLHNAFNEELISELSDLGTKLTTNNDIRIVVLTGSGRSFCAGADLNWMKKTKSFTFEENEKDAINLGTMFHILDELPQAIIGRINGSAIGGGTGLVSICDISVAVEQAKFAFSEVNLGLIPAVISPFVINKIDFHNAREFFLTGERFDANKACSIGLVNYTVKDETELDQKVKYLINQLYSSGPSAIKEAKHLIRTIQDKNMKSLLGITSQKIASIRVSSEAQEGISSFLEKRKPNWIKKLD